MEKEKYQTVTVEAAKTGWIVRVKGKPAEIFLNWEILVRKLERELATKSGVNN